MAYDTPFGRTLDGKNVPWQKALKDGWQSAVRQGRSFGAVGGAYSVCECVVESVRMFPSRISFLTRSAKNHLFISNLTFS